MDSLKGGQGRGKWYNCWVTVVHKKWGKEHQILGTRSKLFSNHLRAHTHTQNQKNPKPQKPKSKQTNKSTPQNKQINKQTKPKSIPLHCGHRSYRVQASDTVTMEAGFEPLLTVKIKLQVLVKELVQS